MEKMQSLKTNAKEKLEENVQELQALKDTNDKLKEMVVTIEKEKEALKETVNELGHQKQVNVSLFFVLRIHLVGSIQVAERLTLPTSYGEVLGSNLAGGGIQLMTYGFSLHRPFHFHPFKILI